MKARELIVWCLFFIAIALLFRHGCGGTQTESSQVYIQGKTDTLIIRDTIISEKIISVPVPIKVEVHGNVENLYNDDSLCIDVTNTYDTIRYYEDSLCNDFAKAIVKSKVNGLLLDQNIILSSYISDTTFVRVDTVKITRAPNINLGIHVAADLKNGPGAGANLQFNRISVGYTYFISGGSQISLGYKIFSR